MNMVGEAAIMMLDNKIASCLNECDAGIDVEAAVEAERAAGIRG
jgi:hypothetical protein